MNKNNIKSAARRITTPLIACVLCALFTPVTSGAQDTALLIQQTPTEGGTVTPNHGVHYFEANSDVTVTAVPKPGYQFVYWLGDVSEPRSNTAVVSLSAPKIIIAVFERSQHDFPSLEEFVKSAPFGGLYASRADYSRTGYTGGGAKRHSINRDGYEPPPPDFPVPDDGDDGDFPVPDVPEPASALLLTLGAAIAILKNPNRNKNRK